METLDPALLLPEIALALAAVCGLLLGSWLPRDRQWLVRLLALAAIVVGLVATAMALATPPETATTGGYLLDTALNAARVIVLAGVALVVLVSTDQVTGARRETEFYVLLLLSALGTVIIAGAGDLLLLAAGYLLSSVPLYALTAFGKDAPGTEAGLKYYLMAALFGVLLLVGVTLLFGAGGGSGYSALAGGLASGPRAAVAVGAVAVLGGLLFKAGAVPAHFWVPDATEGAPAAVAAFITTVPKLGAMVAVYRLGDRVLAGVAVDWPLLVAVVATATMTLGNLAAFAQNSVRRLLAYSTISQVGYLLVAVAASGGSGLALPAMLYYLAAYTVTNIGAFAVVCATPWATTLGDHAGLFRRHPWLALSLVVCLLGLVGSPPTAVFVGKLTVFAAAFDAQLEWLAVVAAGNTVASLFYYLRWIRPLFRRAPGATGGEAATGPVEPWSGAVAVAAATGSVLLGAAAGPLLGMLSGGGLATPPP